MMKFLLLLFVFLIGVGGIFSQNAYVNPEGSYKLVSKTKKKKGEIYGRFGTINVKRISDTMIYFQLDICNGAQSYNNGGAGGTWAYENNQVVYTTDLDTTCKLILTFSATGVTVEQKAANLNMACGFGHAVFADGFYRRKKGAPVFSEQ